MFITLTGAVIGCSSAGTSSTPGDAGADVAQTISCAAFNPDGPEDPNADYGGDTEQARAYLKGVAHETYQWIQWVKKHRIEVVRSCKAVAAAFGSPPQEADVLEAGALRGPQQNRFREFQQLCGVAGQLARKNGEAPEWAPQNGGCVDARAPREACDLRCLLPKGTTCDFAKDPMLCGGMTVPGDCTNALFSGGCAEKEDICDGKCGACQSSCVVVAAMSQVCTKATAFYQPVKNPVLAAELPLLYEWYKWRMAGEGTVPSPRSVIGSDDVTFPPDLRNKGAGCLAIMSQAFRDAAVEVPNTTVFFQT